jgi:hypothetical protein
MDPLGQAWDEHITVLARKSIALAIFLPELTLFSGKTQTPSTSPVGVLKKERRKLKLDYLTSLLLLF